MTQPIPYATEISFKEFVFNHKKNRLILLLILISLVIQFSVYKYLYPFASYIHGDSFSYLTAADKNLTLNTYLIGYSKFLRLFSVFSKPDLSLVLFQYLFIQSSVLLLSVTVFYFYRISKLIQLIIICFMAWNPLFLHLANLISSDGFFLALSCYWFSTLLWIIHRPTNKIVFWHGIALLLCFTVRYNAIIYPFISIPAFLLSDMRNRKKIVGISFGFLMCGWFVLLTMYQYNRITGHWQYSPFSGWQMANNAMYAYRYVDSAERKPVPKRFEILDNMIRKYFDSTRDVKKFPVEDLQASTVYMWTKSLSLYKYRDQLFNSKDSTANEFKRWATMGPFYKEYGMFIIRQYPWHFIRYFIWPNSNKYYAPPLEFLQGYNSGKRYVTPEAAQWFGYNSIKVGTRMKNNKVWVLDFYPILSGIINAITLFTLTFYFILKGWEINVKVKKGIYMCAIVWLLNAVFTIAASSAALRFQSFPIILNCLFVALLIDWLWKVSISTEARLNEANLKNKDVKLKDNVLA